MILDYIDTHKQEYSVEPICRVLSAHGIKIAPSTYPSFTRDEVSGLTGMLLYGVEGSAARDVLQRGVRLSCQVMYRLSERMISLVVWPSARRRAT
ncbi:hypothetical protein JYB55_21690 [Mycolicibacterium septicum]|nr:hypothetical protein [Mycolicibacterium septicum]